MGGYTEEEAIVDSEDDTVVKTVFVVSKEDIFVLVVFTEGAVMKTVFCSVKGKVVCVKGTLRLLESLGRSASCIGGVETMVTSGNGVPC